MLKMNWELESRKLRSFMLEQKVAPTKSTCNVAQTQGDCDLNPQQDWESELRPLNEARTFK